MRGIVIALLAAALALPASAATLSEAKIGFSADRTLVIDGRTYSGRLWTMPGKERHEQNLNGIPAVFVLHDDTPLAALVLPQLHTVVEFPLPPELRLLAVPRLTRKPIGHETVGGVETTKYAIDETVPEGHGEGFLWLSDSGIPMKLDGIFTRPSGRSGHVHWELSHVHLGPQPAALFEPPRDFAKLPAEAVAPLLGLRLKSAH
ncbi:MAG: hypothetical protein JO032_18335 [Alphaproteobacteria bacterium]|nr:hypothetical protein [Alphaproteobacteria bacterium]